MIPKTCQYALAAMVCLAEKRRSMTAHEIAQATGMPEGYLAKVLRKLAMKGLIESRRGPTGGFALSRPADHSSRSFGPSSRSRRDRISTTNCWPPLRDRIEQA